MNWLLKLVDAVWNIRFLTGYRTVIAKVVLVGLSAYQWVATTHPGGLHVPGMPLEWYSPVVAYLGLKLEQFSKEHTA